MQALQPHSGARRPVGPKRAERTGVSQRPPAASCPHPGSSRGTGTALEVPRERRDTAGVHGPGEPELHGKAQAEKGSPEPPSCGGTQRGGAPGGIPWSRACWRGCICLLRCRVSAVLQLPSARCSFQGDGSDSGTSGQSHTGVPVTP